nr:hypothetical protein CFP56_62178 [Quercus suber]
MLKRSWCDHKGRVSRKSSRVASIRNRKVSVNNNNCIGLGIFIREVLLTAREAASAVSALADHQLMLPILSQYLCYSILRFRADETRLPDHWRSILTIGERRHALERMQCMCLN